MEDKKKVIPDKNLVEKILKMAGDYYEICSLSCNPKTPPTVDWIIANWKYYN